MILLLSWSDSVRFPAFLLSPRSRAEAVPHHTTHVTAWHMGAVKWPSSSIVAQSWPGINLWWWTDDLKTSYRGIQKTCATNRVCVGNKIRVRFSLPHLLYLPVQNPLPQRTTSEDFWKCCFALIQWKMFTSASTLPLLFISFLFLK